MEKIARRRRRTARRVYRASRTSFKDITDGVMAGVAAEAAQKAIGSYGVPVGVGLVGFMTKNKTLKTLAGLQAGSIIGDMLPVIGGNGSALGGVY